MYIDEKLLCSDFTNPDSHYKDMVRSALNDIGISYYDENTNKFDLIDTFKCLNDFAELHDIKKMNTAFIDFSNTYETIGHLEKYYEDFVLKNSSGHFSHHFTKTKYEFTENEHKDIHDTINNLRNDIQKSDIFGEEHQTRIVDKLDELQAELNRKMNKLDKALGQISSIGVTLGKFGKDAKPFFDRLNETFKIVHKAEERGDEVTPIDNQLGYESIVETELIEENSPATTTD